MLLFLISILLSFSSTFGGECFVIVGDAANLELSLFKGRKGSERLSERMHQGVQELVVQLKSGDIKNLDEALDLLAKARFEAAGGDRRYGRERQGLPETAITPRADNYHQYSYYEGSAFRLLTNDPTTTGSLPTVKRSFLGQRIRLD
jgi:hypothetical protein